jgi:predicted helicase/uncharacterized protein (DUF2384 family)
MGTFDNLCSQFSVQPQSRGRDFERVCKWLLENAPQYRSIVKNVWLWDEWPGRYGPDTGIDLVVQNNDGHLWAVQAKAYSQERSIPKSEVDSFLSESARREFSYRLLIATTDLIGRNALSTLEGQAVPVGLVTLADLHAMQVEWPDSIADLSAVQRKHLEPRPHQWEALEAIEKGLQEHDRGKVLMACGTGKTLVGLWAMELLHSDLTLVLVPSLSLLKQTLGEWTANADIPFQYMAVCSDQSVDRAGGNDSFVASTSALGVPVTTDPQDVKRFLEEDVRRVMFSTYQSSPAIADAMRLAKGSRFDLVIADEAHRCTGPESKTFSTVLSDDQIPAAKRLFMTATPRYFTGRVKQAADGFDIEVASMDDEQRFGPEIHSLNFSEAIERDLLSDYRVLVVGVDDSMYRQYAESGEFVTIDGEHITDARTLAREIGLAKAIRDYDLKRVITFHGRVNAAKDFTRELPRVIDWMPVDDRPAGKLESDYVSGKMNAGEREVKLRRLRQLPGSDRAVLGNARCLAEGVDVPAIDGVAFIDPRRSQVDVVQAVGRAIRKTEDKSIGTVVIPVFIGDTDDPETALSSSVFEPVWQVVKALRSHDATIGEWLDRLRSQIGRQGKRITTDDLPVRLTIDLPVSVDAEFAGAFATRLVRLSTNPWEEGFGHLEKYVATHGNARPPRTYVDPETKYPLGTWVMTQRTNFKSLSPERRARLDKLGFVSDPFEQQWEEAFHLLEKYVAANGHALVPKNYVDPETKYPLGTWVSRQRFESQKLTPERRARLDKLGFVWDVLAEQWEEGFGHLEKYVATHGNALVPVAYVDPETKYPLGTWVNRQRQSKTLSPEQRARLDHLGFVWDVRAEQWEEGFGHLEKYVAAHGDALVPQNYVDPETKYPLGTWVSRQRTKFKSLSPERRARLDKLGFVWVVRVPRK